MNELKFKIKDGLNVYYSLSNNYSKLKDINFNNFDENYKVLFNFQDNTGDKLAGSTLSIDPFVINPNSNILSAGRRIIAKWYNKRINS